MVTLMQLSFTEKKNIRKNFGKLKEGLSIPNLIAALVLPETELSSGISICCAERLPPAKICNLLFSSK